MKTEKIEQLLEKYFDGETSLEEEEQLRDFFRQDEIPDHLQNYADQFLYLEHAGEAETDIDPLARIGENATKKTFYESDLNAVPAGTRSRSAQWTLRIAAGTILVLIGFSAGLLLNQRGASDEDLAALQSEIRQMKSVLMYGSYQEATASERISAVNLSTRLPASKQLDEEITEILVYTMNNDQNVNVRLAAAEALFKFREEPKISKALAAALPRQTDPLMQITLIDMLVRMKEKSALTEMQKMLMNTETREIVKERLKESIAELKT